MRKINLQLAPPENFQHELEQKGMEDHGPLCLGVCFQVVFIVIAIICHYIQFFVDYT